VQVPLLFVYAHSYLRMHKQHNLYVALDQPSAAYVPPRLPLSAGLSLNYYYAVPNLLPTSTSPLSRPLVPACPSASIVCCSLSVAPSACAAGVADVAVAGAAGVAGAAARGASGVAYV
jgi:hypothetical protein